MKEFFSIPPRHFLILSLSLSLSLDAEQIPFKGSPGEVTLVFSTNSYNSGRGFKLLYTQIPCDSEANRGLITGSAPPSFAMPHGLNINSGNALSSSYDSSPSSTSVASGSQISVIDATPIDHIRTNAAMGPSSGFISPGSPPPATRVPCDLVIYDLFFEISSPGYPYGYPQSADCLYSIRRLNNRICSLVLHFIEVDLSPSPGCQSDYLELDGQRICSGIANDTKKEIDFHSYKVPIRFKTDSIGTRNKGFFLKGIQKECGYMAYSAASSPAQSIQVSADASQNRNSYYPSSSSGRFSPPYEQNSGSGHSIITVTGRAPPLPPVRIKEADFPPALSSSLFPPASNFGNSGETTSSFSSSSSQSSPFSPSPAIISSSTSFTDGSRHHRNRLHPHSISPPPQFSVPGSLAHPSCDLVLNETFFELRSLNYPSRYPSGSKCIYTIERASKNVCNLDLLFVTFDVGDATCLGDHLAIDGDKFCGIIPRERIQSFRFDSRSKAITFIGVHGQGHGFVIRGRQVECGEYSRGPSYLRSISVDQLPPANSNSDSLQTPPISERVPVIPFCDQTFTTNQFTIRSPNYPKDYPASLYCRYTIRRPSEAVCGLEFKLKTFDLEDSAKCGKDFLEIDTGKICGHLPANHESKLDTFHS